MGEFLRNLALLAAVTAAGGVALISAVSSPPRPPAVSFPMIGHHTAAPSATHSPISFAALSAGEHIHVRFASQGCFGDDEHLVLEGTKIGGAVVSRTPHRTNRSRLSHAELQELDLLLAYLRTPRSSGCTTRQQIDVALYRDGVVVATEHFVDESCFGPSGSVLTLRRLLPIVRPPPPSVPQNYPLQLPGATF